MKKVVFVIALVLIAVTTTINVQASTMPEKNNTKVNVCDTEPKWWSCEKWGAQMTTNAGYEFDSAEWYHSKHVYQTWCMANVD